MMLIVMVTMVMVVVMTKAIMAMTLFSYTVM